MPDAVTDSEIHNRTLVSERSNELICLVGMHFAKCAIPAELPKITKPNEPQSYLKAFQACGYRTTFFISSTRKKAGGTRSEFVCRLFVGDAKEPIYTAHKLPAQEKESATWAQVILLKDIYEWLSKNH
jgi:hypothetical protein